MDTIVINYVAVVVAAVLAMMFGALWYSPKMFGPLWMKLSGINESAIKTAQKKGMTTSYVGNFLATLAMAYVLAHFIALIGVTMLSGALQVAFWGWLGFVGTTTLNAVWWEGRSVQLWALNNAQTLLALFIMAIVLFQWQ